MQRLVRYAENAVHGTNLVLKAPFDFGALVDDLSLNLSKNTAHSTPFGYLASFTTANNIREPNVVIAEFGESLSRLGLESTRMLNALSERIVQVLIVWNPDCPDSNTFLSDH